VARFSLSRVPSGPAGVMVTSVEEVDGDAFWHFDSTLLADNPIDSDWTGCTVDGNEPIGVVAGGDMGTGSVRLIYDDPVTVGSQWEVTGVPPAAFAGGSVPTQGPGVVTA
jgi:hypothetical protein